MYKPKKIIKNNMTLIKMNPAREFFRERMMPNEVNSLFESFFNDGLGKFERNVFFTPRVDVLEKTNQFEVHLALPGLKKEEINISIEKNTMTVSGERKLKNENKEDKFHMVENFYGKFSRSFTLPENIDTTKIEGAFEDGMLSVILPKVELKQNTTKVVIK
jgi:HSP20 family protein